MFASLKNFDQDAKSCFKVPEPWAPKMLIGVFPVVAVLN